MRISVKSNITDEAIAITTALDDADSPVTPEYQVHPLTASLRAELSRASGYYGHIFNPDRTTNLDLHAACQKLESFSLESAEPVPVAKPLPEDTQS